MPALDDILLEKIQHLDQKNQKRQLITCASEDGIYVQCGDKRLISFCSNDYLGLSRHPDVIAAAQEALRCFGVGSGASRLVTGNHPLYFELEQQLAQMKHTQAACVFGSGFMAGIGVIPALVEKGDLILIDRLAHASLHRGAKLSGAVVKVFAHNDMDSLQSALERYRSNYRHCLVLTETVFSMDGDIAPVDNGTIIAHEYDSWVMTDDAHGLGIVGAGKKYTKEKSEPLLEAEGNKDVAVINNVQADIQMGTLSKAVGSYGGYVCASQNVVDYLVNKAASLIYTTALPPAILAASLASLKYIQANDSFCQKPLEHAYYFTKKLGLEEAASAIVPLVIGEESSALAASDILREAGFLVGAIRPPTVPKGTARLRFTFSALHKKEDIDALVEVILQHKMVALSEKTSSILSGESCV